LDESLHGRANAAPPTAVDRGLSLVDCFSFELMRRLGPNSAFAIDTHFAQQGFRCIP